MNVEEGQSQESAKEGKRGRLALAREILKESWKGYLAILPKTALILLALNIPVWAFEFSKIALAEKAHFLVLAAIALIAWIVSILLSVLGNVAIIKLYASAKGAAPKIEGVLPLLLPGWRPYLSVLAIYALLLAAVFISAFSLMFSLIIGGAALSVAPKWLIVAMIVIGVLLVCAFVCACSWIVVKLSLSYPLCVLEGLNPISALIESWKRARGNFLSLLYVYFAAAALIIAIIAPTIFLLIHCGEQCLPLASYPSQVLMSFALAASCQASLRLRPAASPSAEGMAPCKEPGAQV